MKVVSNKSPTLSFVLIAQFIRLLFVHISCLQPYTPDSFYQCVPEIEKEEGDNFENRRILLEHNEDAIVRNLISDNYTGVVLSACCVKSRGQAVSYRSVLSEIVSSGRHLNRALGHLNSINVLSEAKDAEADQAMLMLNGCAGVVECARSLLERGIGVQTDTLYTELWVTGRLHHNGPVNFDFMLREL